MFLMRCSLIQSSGLYGQPREYFAVYPPLILPRSDSPQVYAPEVA